MVPGSCNFSKFRADTGKPIIMIADNASYHRGKTLQRFVEESDGDLVIEHLPHYAPWSNPDEQIWNHAKARLVKLFIATKDDLLREMRKIMRSIQQSPALISSSFQLENTRYAASALCKSSRRNLMRELMQRLNSGATVASAALALTPQALAPGCFRLWIGTAISV
jgi:transposase